METVSRALLTFLLNSLWQIPLAAAVAALACRLMRHGPASHRHAVWVAALASALLLPLASVRIIEPLPAPHFDVKPPEVNAAPATASRQPALTVSAPESASRTISFEQTTVAVVLGAYLLFLLFRLLQLAWAALRTAGIRWRAQSASAPPPIERVADRCQKAFGLRGVRLLFSPRVSGPVTAGNAIVLPETLRGEASEDVLTTAIGHEMAHIARRDFACNLLYELLGLPVSFHPAAWLIRRGIERTREMACDELVTRRLIDAGAYARSILDIAAAMTALPRPGYTLGVFDGDILEERIRRLVERPAANLKRARLLLATGLSALAVCAVVASGLALTARAQGAAEGVLKQAEAAYTRGDHKTAAELYATAVQLDPANLQARLFLAGSLLAQYVPATALPSPFVDGARQQYQEVIARDPRNRQAFDGMILTYINTRQFAEAHDWAVKATLADATDKFAYYAAGFTDWSLAYPDYASARLSAGMTQQDPGIIPDASLRQSVRAQHGAQVEEGMHMLDVALQLDPDYADAMAYMNLLDRIEAGLADTPAQAADLIAQADGWVKKTLDAKRKEAQNAPLTARIQDPLRAAVVLVAPLPPPPPPPPPGISGVVPPPPAGDAASPRIRVDGAVQAAKLERQVAPVMPAVAQQARISGMVQMQVIVAKDGTVRDIQLLSGHPLLVPPALEAVKQWVYQPTLLNGQPVEVTTTINVNFVAQP